jgi:hypothetical protein
MVLGCIIERVRIAQLFFRWITKTVVPSAWIGISHIGMVDHGVTMVARFCTQADED